MASRIQSITTQSAKYVRSDAVTEKKHDFEKLIDKSRLLQTFKKLLEHVSSSCNENQFGLIDLIKAKLDSLGIKYYMDESNVAAKAEGVKCKVKAGVEAEPTVGNLIAHVPATVAGALPINFSVHTDCQDFLRPISWIVENGVMKAKDDNQLCADNQLGIAELFELLTVLKENNIPHGEINIVFAWGEEAGILGMSHIDPKNIKGDVFFSLDSDSRVTIRGGGDIVAGSAEIKGEAAPIVAAKALKAMGATPNRLYAADRTATMNISYITGGIKADWFTEKFNTLANVGFVTWSKKFGPEEKQKILAACEAMGANGAKFQTVPEGKSSEQLFIPGVVVHPAFIKDGGINACHVGALLLTDNEWLVDSLVDFQCGSKVAEVPNEYIEPAMAEGRTNKSISWQTRVADIVKTDTYANNMASTFKDECKKGSVACAWKEDFKLDGYASPIDGPAMTIWSSAQDAAGVHFDEPEISLAGSNANTIYSKTNGASVIVITSGQNETAFKLRDAYDAMMVLGAIVIEASGWKRVVTD
jgi:tripeptide aminopeptidase